MVADSGDGNSKVVVQAYLPEYQRDEWDAHADELEMNRSEFVKTMVQAGRRGFEGAPVPEPTTGVADSPEQAETADTPNTTDGTEVTTPHPGEPLEETVVAALSDAEYLSWDDLLAAVTDDIESRLEETLQSLQAQDRVRYSGRHGGYTLDR